jgi:polysaccharide export outer membrane protein
MINIVNNTFRLLRPTTLMGLLLLTGAPLYAFQLTPGQATEAKRQLGLMSPEEIDQKIKDLGMTRDEAERRAKENGIDLESFLRGSTPSSVSAASESVLLESGPQAGPTVQSAAALPTVTKRKFPTSNGLSYFGYEVFATTPSAFEPSATGPIDPDYIIGPEDVLRVSVWGQVEQQNELTVDKEGRIFIPTAGPVVVSGLTINEVQKVLVKQLSRSFQGLAAKPPTVWLDVTLARVRPKRIFIMGEVNNPGGYTVNSYANVFNSLFAVGGPTVNGSLREVRLIRGNKIIARIDLYLYLTGAEKNNDVRVQNNDIIYVPVRKNTMYIQGEVRRPGIYELLPGENLKKLLEYAGGNLPTSYLERVQVSRIIPMKERVKNELERRYVDINYREIVSKNADYTLADGDVVTFYSILDEVKNYVSISGSVFKPGTYQLTPNMRLMDLIQLADSLRPETYYIRGELTRLLEDNKTRLTIPFDLKSLLGGDQQQNLILQPKDQVLIHSIDISKITDEFVEIFGSVKRPGRYPLTNNMTLIDVLMLAGGFTEDAERTQARIARIDPAKTDDTLAYILYADLPDLFDTLLVKDFAFLEKFRETDFKLQRHDQIFIRSNPNFQIQQLVTISGEVNYPGQYALRTYNDYLSDLIRRAGGVTSAAHLRGGKLTRHNERVNVDFQSAVESPKSYKDLVLHPGDDIVIPKKPNTVRMAGEVNNKGLLSFIEGEKLWDYIDRAGGLTDSADYVILYSPNGNAERFRTGWFAGNTKVYDGSTIVVTKVPAPPPEQAGERIGNVIRDVFAIMASALTIIVLAKQL